MTELSFLIDLLLNGRLQKTVQEKVRQRIEYVEQNMSLPQAIKQHQRSNSSVPIEAAVTAQATQAVLERQATIQAAVNQKPIEVSTGSGSRGPRKF